MAVLKKEKTDEWNDSFLRRENFLFYPQEEVVRFIAKYVRKRRGYDDVTVGLAPKPLRVLDLGCGIGRHLKYLS